MRINMPSTTGVWMTLWIPKIPKDKNTQAWNWTVKNLPTNAVLLHQKLTNGGKWQLRNRRNRRVKYIGCNRQPFDRRQYRNGWVIMPSQRTVIPYKSLSQSCRFFVVGNFRFYAKSNAVLRPWYRLRHCCLHASRLRHTDANNRH